MSGGTVPLGLSVVNTLFPMESRGIRLRRFLVQQTGGNHGWVNELADAAQINRQNLSAWMGGRSEPDLNSIRVLAEGLTKLGHATRPYQILAAMDGDGDAVALNDQTRSAILTLMEEWADQRGLPKPRRGSAKETGAA